MLVTWTVRQLFTLINLPVGNPLWPWDRRAGRGAAASRAGPWDPRQAAQPHLHLSFRRASCRGPCPPQAQDVSSAPSPLSVTAVTVSVGSRSQRGEGGPTFVPPESPSGLTCPPAAPEGVGPRLLVGGVGGAGAMARPGRGDGPVGLGEDSGPWPPGVRGVGPGWKLSVRLRRVLWSPSLRMLAGPPAWAGRALRPQPGLPVARDTRVSH